MRRENLGMISRRKFLIASGCTLIAPRPVFAQ
jgi:hypothetical protein